jgi:hypothetical protein
MRDNFPSKGSLKFSAGVGLEEAFLYIFPARGTRILSDFTRFPGNSTSSLSLKVLLAQRFRLVQQALITPQQLGEID